MKRGFTLVEIMIVVAIIGLLSSIAVPSFMKSRATSQKNSCVNNMRLIETAKDLYALETGRTNGWQWPDAGSGFNELCGTGDGFGGYMKRLPWCPASRSESEKGSLSRTADDYELTAIGSPPAMCKAAGHSFPLYNAAVSRRPSPLPVSTVE